MWLSQCHGGRAELDGFWSEICCRFNHHETDFQLLNCMWKKNKHLKTFSLSLSLFFLLYNQLRRNSKAQISICSFSVRYKISKLCLNVEYSELQEKLFITFFFLNALKCNTKLLVILSFQQKTYNWWQRFLEIRIRNTQKYLKIFTGFSPLHNYKVFRTLK